MKRISAFALVGLVAGGLGFALGRVNSASQDESARAVSPPEVRDALASPSPPTSPPQEMPAVLPPLPPPSRSGDEGVACEERVVQLERALEQTSQRLSREQERRAEREGRPTSWPEDLDERYGQRRLLEAFSRAFAEGEVPGEITSIDCTEFPCIVYGTVSHPRELNKLFKAPGMASYGEDERQVGVWREKSQEYSNEGGADEKPGDSTYFGVSLYPGGNKPNEDEDIAKRVRHRQEQMWEVSKPAP